MPEIETKVENLDNKEVNKDVISKFEKDLATANKELERLKTLEDKYNKEQESNKVNKEKDLATQNEFKTLYEQKKAELDDITAKHKEVSKKASELELFKAEIDKKNEIERLKKIDDLVKQYSYDDTKKNMLKGMTPEQFNIYLSLLPDIKTPANSIDTIQQNTMQNIDETKMNADELFKHKFKLLYPEVKN